METQRLNFIINRDGLEAAITFAKQTYKVYRSSLMRSRKRGFNPPHHASIPEYRRSFILSCVSFRKFIHEHSNT